MVNYSLKYGVSETARLLGVEKNLIKKWAYAFSENLSPNANPPKGQIRQFSVEDISAFFYIQMYWEDDPDIESIRIGLNLNEHLEEPYSEIITELTPIFREFSEEDMENRIIRVIGGMANYNVELFTLANSYKLAGDILVDHAVKDEEHELTYPIIYNYRHATELFLKSVTSNPEDHKHNLNSASKEVKKILKEKFDIDPPEWFDDMVLVFDDFDEKGTRFRYGIEVNKDETVVDLLLMKRKMGMFAESFQRIKAALNPPNLENC